MKRLSAHKILAILGLAVYTAYVILFLIEIKRPAQKYWIQTDLGINLGNLFTVWEEILMWTLFLLPVFFGILALVWNYKRKKTKSSTGLYSAVLITGLICTAGLTFAIIHLWSIFADEYMRSNTWLNQATDFLFPRDYVEKGLRLSQNICASVLTGLVFTTSLLTLLIRNQPEKNITNIAPATS
jgi:hypothetical protein